MTILIKSKARQLFKNKSKIGKESWDQLEYDLEEQVKDIASNIQEIHLKQGRKIATVEDMREGLNKYREKYAAEMMVKLGQRMEQEIKNAVKNLTKEVNAYYGAEIQTTLPKGTEEN